MTDEQVDGETTVDSAGEQVESSTQDHPSELVDPRLAPAENDFTTREEPRLDVVSDANNQVPQEPAIPQFIEAEVVTLETEVAPSEAVTIAPPGERLALKQIPATMIHAIKQWGVIQKILALPKEKKLLGGITTSVVVLGIVIALIVFVGVPHVVRNNFWKTREEFTYLQSKLTNIMAQAEESLSLSQLAEDAEETAEIELADPAVLDDMIPLLAQAQTLIKSPPAMAEKTPDIRNQTQQMNIDNEDVLSMILDLFFATDMVDKSRVEYFTDRLSALIDQAQEAYDHSEGLVPDEQIRTSLMETIESAQQAQESLPTLKRTAVVESFGEQSQALADGIAAIAAVQQTRCYNDVLVPFGIDPIVCGGMPIEALPYRVNGPHMEATIFKMPSGNIACSTDGYTQRGMYCEILNRNWRTPPELMPNNPHGVDVGAWMIWDGQVSVGLAYGGGDVYNWEWAREEGIGIPVLQYGKIADMQVAACKSQETGVLCWDVTTHHGFRINLTDFVYW
ncbi:MAG: hypothetical protein FWG08_05495 [Propionibacteriaceae bacterium]|nr:hypothetical protein [Propionibacteriaceae bacterium]